MGSSFVSLNDYGFWISDGFLQLWLHFLAQQVDAIPEAPDWLQNAGDYWRIQSKWGGVGCVDAGLDDYAATPEQVDLLITLSHQALTTIHNYGDVLSTEQLNSLDLAGVWTKDIPTRKMIALGQQFIKLLKGELTSTASSQDSLPTIWQP
jgi:hypothetical protein